MEKTPPLKHYITKPCLHCHNNLKLSRWDSWNGFLVRCPRCRKMHGKHWRIKPTIWVSIFLNAFSFFFTLRPRKALIPAATFLIAGVIGKIFLHMETFSQFVEIIGVFMFFILPVLINCVIVLIHEDHLNHENTWGNRLQNILL